MRIAQRLTRLEGHHAPPSKVWQIVIFDPVTGVPLPGHEPDPDAPGYIWLPAKDPLPDPWGHDEREACRDDARCD